MSFKNKTPDQKEITLKKRQEAFRQSNPFRLLVNASTPIKKIEIAQRTLKKLNNSITSFEKIMFSDKPDTTIDYAQFLDLALQEQRRWLDILSDLTQKTRPTSPFSPVESYLIGNPEITPGVFLKKPILRKSRQLTRSQSSPLVEYSFQSRRCFSPILAEEPLSPILSAEHTSLVPSH